MIAHQFTLARPSAPLIALGGGLKSTVCVVQGDRAYVSDVIGDLNNPAHCVALEETVAQMSMYVQSAPSVIVCDRHPDFFSSRLAESLAASYGVPTLAVQHHHAHIAAVCAEHDYRGSVLGLALDGFGWGDDGGAWGGELLRVNGARSERLSHLKPLALPGGDRAAREPWRMAAAALHGLGRNEEILARWPTQPAASTVAGMLTRAFNTSETSSMGRLFDAAAGLLGISVAQQFEGEAAMMLQTLAEAYGTMHPMSDGYVLSDQLDFLPLLARLSSIEVPAYGAALFHATVAEGLSQWVQRAATETGITTLVCGGGCFMNSLLLRLLQASLNSTSIRVLTAQRLSPGDSSLSLGQAWVGMDYQRGN